MNGAAGRLVVSPLPHTLIYLSCGFDALRRDCDALLAATRPPGSSGSDSSFGGGGGYDGGYCGGPATATAANGGLWQLVEATAFLFFPGTDSLETLAIFKRIG